VIEGAGDPHRLAVRAGHADDEAELELDVQARARSIDRFRIAGVAPLSVRTADRGPADDDGA
jgi:hypothetical protein